MATQTTNLNLVKPDYTDAADIAVINGNMDTIDSHVHGNDVDIAGIATIITGTTNNSGHSISSGEYFIANGAKYKASATIGTGVTWANKATSVSDHDLINALNSNLIKYNEETVTTSQYAFASLTVNLGRVLGIWVVSPVRCVALRSNTDNNMVQIVKLNNSSATADTWAHVISESVKVRYCYI